MAKQGAAFVDPMAGSGTFAFEALGMAADFAPGLHRERFGFHGWRAHDSALWQTLLNEAQGRAEIGLAAMTNTIIVADAEESVVEIAERNAAGVGWADRISFEVRSLDQWTKAPAARGLVATNPPYGQRLGGPIGARRTVGELGRVLQRVFVGWRATVLLGDDRLAHVLTANPEKLRAVDNGTIEGQAVVFEVGPAEEQTELARAFANRLKKNQRGLKAWLKRDGVTCYRLYDADIPEANVAVDRYGDWVHVQEYEAPATIDPEVAARRLQQLLYALPDALGVGAENVVVKQRKRQRGSAQYNKQGDDGARFLVHEGGHRFWVNLQDYLDTGLFLDHRPVRALIGQRIGQLVGQAQRPTFLNLFSYTSSATVYAIDAGAARTTSVDLSNTHLSWSRDNFTLAGVTGNAHELVKDDVQRFLTQERRLFDVILLDPPTFSTSKSMTTTLDIQRDHPMLIAAAMDRLAPDGELLFSTNARRFKLESVVAGKFTVVDISDETIPPDFARNRRIHRCFRITHR